jgi:hypothetical protein
MLYDVDDREAKIFWKAVRYQYDAEPTNAEAAASSSWIPSETPLALFKLRRSTYRQGALQLTRLVSLAGWSSADDRFEIAAPHLPCVGLLPTQGRGRPEGTFRLSPPNGHRLHAADSVGGCRPPGSTCWGIVSCPVSQREGTFEKCA